MKLSAEERKRLEALIHAGRSLAQTLKRGRILLKADVSEAGEGCSDSAISAALDTSVNNVARTRQLLVEEGSEAPLKSKYNPNSARPRIFDGAANGTPKATRRDRGQLPILREIIQRDSHIREILIFSVRKQGRVGPATTWKCDRRNSCGDEAKLRYGKAASFCGRTSHAPSQAPLVSQYGDSVGEGCHRQSTSCAQNISVGDRFGPDQT